VQDPSSTINIGCTPSLGLGLLPKLLNMYLTKTPGTKFNVVNLQSIDLEEQLKELTFDLIICFNPDHSELFQKTQLLEGLLVLAAPLNNSPEGKIFKLSQIKKQPFIKVKNLKTGSSKRNLDNYLDSAGVKVNWIAETETMQVAKAMVEQGAGYAIIDDFSAQVYGSRISVHKLEPSIPYEICMVSNKEKPLSVSAQKFIDFLSGSSINSRSFVID
jgi:DNA-binding transcriptional LysR family regulator